MMTDLIILTVTNMKYYELTASRLKAVSYIEQPHHE